MIDYFALALGHGLLAFALVHLFFGEEVDHDPLIGAIKDQTNQNRMTASAAGRNARRRAKAAEQAEDPRAGAGAGEG
jgi:hypothetical protein